MKSNIKTNTMTFKSLLVVLVISLALGIITSIFEKNLLAKSNNTTLEISTEIKEQQVEIADTLQYSVESTVSSRHYVSRVQAELDEQKNQLTQIENIKAISISVDMDLTQRTGLSKEEFKMLIGNLKADTSKFFYENSDYIYDLCEKYELNEIFFCGLISAESGWNIAQNHRNTHNYISLMLNGKLIRYNSLEEGLEVAAKTLHEKYLSEDGKFFYGKTLSGVKTKFCPSSTWINLVYGRMNQIVQAKNIEI